ncbi:endonuclease/exonuclease/phosphatase family protein [Modestobacter sp. DSM 44400]|uniref:endonuclease/exonuclease/phosphatase family protein n=1 Tax=Modestobacter sp. DSM 44400 TaxID=1550230 RepID=UPI000B89EF9B|nr:endonuclease/exonuclease/phosphatase family protein [Modestobacter sp. DSM 44400]
MSARQVLHRVLRRRRGAAALTAPWAVWALLRATGIERGFPLVPALAFTPYAAATSVLPVAVAVRSRAWGAAAVSAAAAATLTGAVLSRARRRPTTWEPGTRRLRLATVSLRLGQADPQAVVDLVTDHRVDVLALQEVTPEATIALRTAGLGDLLPHSHVIAARDGSPPAAGGALWSRLPMLERCAVAGRFEQPTARLGVPGAPDVEVTAVHTNPPSTSPQSVARWTADLAELPAPETGVLRVLAGDFNATLDHRALRRVLALGYRDAAWAVGQALRATWTPLRSPEPRLTLDHVLVDPQLGVASVTLVPIAGSDHRAVVAELVLPQRAG